MTAFSLEKYRDRYFANGSQGPYGFILLGLGYRWDDSEKCLKIKSVMLAVIDLKLRKCVEHSVYEDALEYPFQDIYEENGRFFYEGYPIINYKMVSIPEILTGVEEKKGIFNKTFRHFHNYGTGLKYSVNPICTSYSASFESEYKELFACILSFDAETMTGSGVGFDGIGKIVNIWQPSSVKDLYRRLVNQSDYWSNQEEYMREAELGFLNLSFKTDAQGNKEYCYQSIWDV